MEMPKYRKKPVVIEAITFDQLVDFGIRNSENLVNGLPISFEYKGYPITLDNYQCYLIPTSEGVMNMTPKDMLITGVAGEIYPCKIDIFKKTYEQVPYYWETGIKETKQKTINDKSFEYRDCIFNRTTIKLSVWDSIKAMLGREIKLNIDIYVMNDEAEVQYTDHKMIVDDLFKKKPKKGYTYQEPDLTDSKKPKTNQ